VKLFPKDRVVGTFRGFSEGGLEFHAELTLPYRTEFQSTPMHGQFLLVQLESENEAVLGRITSMSSQGRMATTSGEDFANRAIQEERSIPEDLLEQYLKYKVNIRVLGVERVQNNRLVFAASHRRLPHLGSRVAFLSPEILMEVAGHNLPGADLGFFALGEFIYAGDDARLGREDWMQVRHPQVIAKFNVKNLVARRSFVFARAGFGKSNLVKLLFSNLYRETPTVLKQGKHVPVGTVIFDPDGEYFWPDVSGRPGLCDVDGLADRLVVFTARANKSAYYQSFVAGAIRLDIRRLRAADVVAIALPPERQTQQNVLKLRRLPADKWRELVDEVWSNGTSADEKIIAKILGLTGSDISVEAIAAKSNMLTIVHMLHDPSSQMLDILMEALKAGKICVIDLSQMRGTQGFVLSGILLQRIFDRNQEEFTKADAATIPVIAVVEEAQAVLGSSGSSAEGPYVTWVKEGRKYDLGAVLVTQQPGSIPHELLSQGDNWFVFHLLSAGDLQALKRANAHFSDDLLSGLLNEPLPGNGVFWSSVEGKSYPLPIRALSFEHASSVKDPAYRLPAAETFAAGLKSQFDELLRVSQERIPVGEVGADGDRTPVERAGAAAERFDLNGAADPGPDVMEVHIQAAIRGFCTDAHLIQQIRERGMPWRGVKEKLLAKLPSPLDDVDQLAFDNVRRTLNAAFGEGNWTTEMRPRKSGVGGDVRWVVVTGVEKSSPGDSPGQLPKDDAPF
jgi:DNA-directed RNA polymerase subunit F